jgi:hypothetical protein
MKANAKCKETDNNNQQTSLPWKRELRFVSISLSILTFSIAFQNQNPHSLFHLLLLRILVLFTVSEAQSPNAISLLIGSHKTTTLFALFQSTLEPPLSLPFSSIAPSPVSLPSLTLAGLQSLSL